VEDLPACTCCSVPRQGKARQGKGKGKGRGREMHASERACVVCVRACVCADIEAT